MRASIDISLDMFLQWREGGGGGIGKRGEKGGREGERRERGGEVVAV